MVTLAAIISVRYLAAAVGRWLSRGWRSSASIPKACRDPLGSDVAMKKWCDQAWQLAVHFSMAVLGWPCGR